MNTAETIILITDEGDAQVYSCQHNWISRMKKLGIPPTQTSDSGGTHGCWYKIPKAWVKIRKPRVMTEEQREKLVERGKRLAASQKNKPIAP
jgi:hypothetical protein